MIRAIGSSTQKVSKLRLIVNTAASGIIFGFLVVALVVLSMGTIPEIESPRYYIAREFNKIAADAYQHRLHSSSLHGGSGTYFGYEYQPVKQEENSVHAGRFFFRIVSLYSDSILIEGRYENEMGKSAVHVKIDPEGKLMNWQYLGDFY